MFWFVRTQKYQLVNICQFHLIFTLLEESIDLRGVRNLFEFVGLYKNHLFLYERETDTPTETLFDSRFK